MGLPVDGDTTDWLQMPSQVGDCRIWQRREKLIKLLDIRDSPLTTVANGNHQPVAVFHRNG
jgi:hypothetical protein